MLIDWFTVGAQTLNFLILVWLLKRFLYRPVQDAIAAREKRIAQQVHDAQDAVAKAASERDALARKSDEFEQQRAGLLAQASQQAQAERQRLLSEARAAADLLLQQRKEALANQEQHLWQAVGERPPAQVFSLARKGLADRAGSELEERMVQLFCERVHDMSEDEHLLLAEAASGSQEPLLVRSTLDLSATQQTQVNKAVNEALKNSLRLQFQTAPQLVCGIELSCGGRKIGWNIDQYLAELRRSVKDLASPDAPPAPPADRPTQSGPAGTPAKGVSS